MDKSREDHEKEVLKELCYHECDLIILAGYMRILSAEFIKSLNDQGKFILNIHPSLLPAFPGMDAQKQALDSGVKIAGCTVHLVNEIVDGGEILGQMEVNVQSDDTEETLSKRILEKEHILYSAVIQNIAKGNIRLS